MTSFRERGRRGETEIRRLLKKHFFVFVHGLSTPGVDIVAIKKDLAVFLEVKSTTKDEFRVPVSQIQELYRAAEEFSEKVGIPCKCYIIVKFVGKGYVIVEPPAEYDKKYYVIKPNKVLTRRQLLECILSQKIHDIL